MDDRDAPELVVDPELRTWAFDRSPTDLAAFERMVRERPGDHLPGSVVAARLDGRLVLLWGFDEIKICEMNGLSPPAPIVRDDILDRAAAKTAIVEQMVVADRPTTEEQRTYLRGRIYNEEKGGRGGDRRSNPHGAGLNVARRLGERFGKDPATIERNGAFARGIDKIGEASTKAKAAILDGRAAQVRITQSAVIKIGRRSASEVAAWTQDILHQIELRRRATRKPRLRPRPPRPSLDGATTQALDLYYLFWPGEDEDRSHRLLCGDATHPLHIARLLDGVKPKVCISDPPYGVNYHPATRTRQRRTTDLAMPGDSRWDWSDAFRLLPSVDVLYHWHAVERTADVAGKLHDIGFEVRHQIVWVKPNAPPSGGTDGYLHQAERAWYAVRAGKTQLWRGQAGAEGRSDVWKAPSVRAAGSTDPHWTPKPPLLFEIPIKNHLLTWEWFVDPFVGSGTSIFAADATNRRCLAMEIDPRRVDAIVEEWQHRGGRVARLPFVPRRRVRLTDEQQAESDAWHAARLAEYEPLKVAQLAIVAAAG